MTADKGNPHDLWFPVDWDLDTGSWLDSKICVRWQTIIKGKYGTIHFQTLDDIYSAHNCSHLSVCVIILAYICQFINETNLVYIGYLFLLF